MPEPPGRGPRATSFARHVHRDQVAPELGQAFTYDRDSFTSGETFRYDGERLGTDFLNGIVYDPAAETFYLTGTWWPTMFEVRFVQ